MGTDNESTRWWNAEVAERAMWSGSVLHQKCFEKYVLGNALMACFEAVSGLDFYNICTRLVIFCRIYMATVGKL